MRHDAKVGDLASKLISGDKNVPIRAEQIYRGHQINIKVPLVTQNWTHEGKGELSSVLALYMLSVFQIHCTSGGK